MAADAHDIRVTCSGCGKPATAHPSLIVKRDYVVHDVCWQRHNAWHDAHHAAVQADWEAQRAAQPQCPDCGEHSRKLSLPSDHPDHCCPNCGWYPEA